MTPVLDITPSPRLLQMLGEIPLQPWQCLAELVDNSIDELLKIPDRTEENPLTVDIEVEDNGLFDTILIVRDNGLGMTEKELERSLKAGHSGKSRYGSLGLFGMGFNIATARLGSFTEVFTSVVGSTERLKATIDFKELQSQETFQVPMEVSRTDKEKSGTEVRIKLKRSQAQTFLNKAKNRAVSMKLGDVYSYLLRDSVPGLKPKFGGQDIPVILRFDEKEVKPRLPCLWSDQRSVTYKGEEVHAVQYINYSLSEATACLECGHWDTSNGPTECDECDSIKLQKRDRRIWGWLGMQRYLDTKDYGIDFLRYGRKILIRDKDIFVFRDPDTLEEESEYPIEMPANRGRIVGEIHLDHVPVVYQKDHFDRQTRAWSVARDRVRGEGPLRPNYALRWKKGHVNASELGKLYSAYRRNEAGSRYLHPGDGKGAIHEEAKRWAKSFYKGVPKYQDDTLWYEAAEKHQRIKDGTDDSVVQPDPTPGDGEKISDIIDLPSKKPDTTETTPTPTFTTQLDEMEQARALGSEIPYLSRPYKLGGALGTWELTVWVTQMELKASDGTLVASKPGNISGRKIEIFVHVRHEIFQDYGRDIRDVSLMEAATLIKGLNRTETSAPQIYADLVRDTPDLKAGKNAINERIDSFIRLLRRALLPVVSRDPETAGAFWGALDAQDKLEIENAAAVRFPQEKLETLASNGTFVEACDAGPLAKLVSKMPAKVFDGQVFKGLWNGANESVQSWRIDKVVTPLKTLAAFKGELDRCDNHDIRIAQIHLDYLESQLIEVD